MTRGARMGRAGGARRGGIQRSGEVGQSSSQSKELHRRVSSPNPPPPPNLPPTAFDLVIAVIASIGDVLAPYTLPALFALVLLPDLPRLERWLLRMIVPVSALFAAAGLYASGYRLVEVLGS